MKFLLDTHLVIWALIDDRHISQQARKVLIDPANQLLFSVLSI
jgi:PIN domain nuclease of toxin-antitoxin system